MVNTKNGSAAVRRTISGSNDLAGICAFILTLLLFLFVASCAKDDMLQDSNLETRDDGKIRCCYEVTNLVSDVEEYNPEIIDPNLINAWGIAISPTGVFWISAADAELSVIYDDEGHTLRPPVKMDGEPTGQVFNNTTGFVIPEVGAARFIFATEYGSITAWRTGNVATTMVDNSATGASYTGIELASDGTGNYLYVANVAQGRVDVFDSNWNLVSKPFMDPAQGTGSPFNVNLIFGKLYVTYTGPNESGGFVDIFNTDGSFVKRFATGGTLDAPWGITNTPPEFGLGQSILVGNFGDGRINVYNKNGQFKGQLGDEEGDVIVIDGLWALEFTPAAFAGTVEPDLYFTAGPDDEEHGLFGEIEHIEDEEATALTTAPLSVGK